MLILTINVHDIHLLKPPSTPDSSSKKMSNEAKDKTNQTDQPYEMIVQSIIQLMWHWKCFSPGIEGLLATSIVANTFFSGPDNTRTAHLTCILLLQKPDSTASVVTVTVPLVLMTLVVM